MVNKSTDNMYFKITTKLAVVRNPNLPKEFCLNLDDLIRVEFAGFHHPGRVVSGELPLRIGESGLVQILIAAMKEEEDVIRYGLRIRLLGGVDIYFAEAELLDCERVSESM